MFRMLMPEPKRRSPILLFIHPSDDFSQNSQGMVEGSRGGVRTSVMNAASTAFGVPVRLTNAYPKRLVDVHNRGSSAVMMLAYTAASTLPPLTTQQTRL